MGLRLSRRFVIGLVVVLVLLTILEAVLLSVGSGRGIQELWR